jgi:hypothetical protein
VSGTPKRYAVVSCHVERLLDDRVWAHYQRLLRRRPGGFRIASLLRPPDEAFGEDEQPWLERAAEAAARGPLGHHTHWTAPDHARPTRDDNTGERVRREGNWMRERGLAPTLFCGGGWYTDASVAEACVELGYLDCTPRAERPSYLVEDAPWAELRRPAGIRLVSGAKLAALPTTRSIGSLLRALTKPGSLTEPVVHVYLHDTDLLDRPRRVLTYAALVALGRRRSAAEPEAGWTDAAELPWSAVLRGAGASAAPA